MFAIATTPSPRRAYDALAPHYEDFTSGQDYARWIAALLELARRHGVAGRRLLDGGCGTGKSFAGLPADGWAVTACDASTGMLARARERHGHAARLHLADLRDLPAYGPHDLAWALCDVANYQLTERDLTAVLAGLRRNLVPGGVALFDCSTVKAYRDFFGATIAQEIANRLLVWHGRADGVGFAPGDHAPAVMYAFVEERNGSWSRTVSRHLQRHHPRDVVERALRTAGLALAAVYGQTADLRFEPDVDEERHDKAIYVAINDTREGR